MRPAAAVCLVVSLGFALGQGLRAQDGDAEQPPAAAEAEAEPGSGPLWKQTGKCQVCHVQADWWVIQQPPEEEGFDHTATGFALRDAHAKTGPWPRANPSETTRQTAAAGRMAPGIQARPR